MTSGIRHARSNRVAGRHCSSQRSASHGATTSVNTLQRTRSAPPPQVEEPKKRGRKPGSQTKLKQPGRGGKVALKPSGDIYVSFKPIYKYTTQLGVILKRQYPGLIEEKDDNGAIVEKHVPLDWDDYFLDPNGFGVTSGDRVLSEFWRLFEIAREDQEEADRVFDNYLKKRVRDMMYQARVDCVKEYYRTIGEPLDDTLARPIVLKYEQYLQGQIKWFDDAVWPELCSYWCSDEFKGKRKIGQECRSSSTDIALNHGGSRPFTETQQVLDDYITGARRAACPEGEDELQHEYIEEDGQQYLLEQNLNAQVLYDVSSGGPRTHGRFTIGNGAVRSADVRAAAKERSVRPSSIAREVAQLRHENPRLQQANREKDSALQQNKLHTELILGFYQDLGKEVPKEALRLLSASQAIGAGSSHVGSQSTNDGNPANGHSSEDHYGDGLADGHSDENQHGANGTPMETSNPHGGNHTPM